MLVETILFFTLFACAYILRQLGLVNKGHAAFLLKIVVNLGLPLLIIGTVSQTALSTEYILLPVSAILIAMLCGIAGAVFASSKSAKAEQTGVIISSAMIMNLAIVYPFVSFGLSRDMLTTLVLFDLGNGLMAFTVVYFIASYFGKGRGELLSSFLKVMRFPPFIALFVALGLNVFSIELTFMDYLASVGSWLIILVFPAMGIYANWRSHQMKPVFPAVGIRVIVGGLAGVLLILFLPIDESTAMVILLAAISPVGFNTVVFAVDQNLDHELAANISSISILLSLLYLPAAMYLIKQSII